MKKILASLALAGAMATGAHAQVFNGPVNGNYNAGAQGTYQVTIDETVTPTASVVIGGTNYYEYTYGATLTGNTAGGSITTFTFNPQTPAAFVPVGPAGPTVNPNTFGFSSVVGAGYTPPATPTSGYTFSSTGSGLTKAGPVGTGDSVTFNFFSTLPPTSTVAVVPSGTPSGQPAGQNPVFYGPGAAVPEPGSLALIGLGLLPLAFVARRRAGRGA